MGANLRTDGGKPFGKSARPAPPKTNQTLRIRPEGGRGVNFTSGRTSAPPNPARQTPAAPAKGPMGFFTQAAQATGLYFSGMLARSAGTPGASRMSSLGLGPTGRGSDAPVYQTPLNNVTPEQVKASKKTPPKQGQIYGSLPTDGSANYNLASYDSSVTLPNTRGSGNAGSSKQGVDPAPRPSPTVKQEGRSGGKLSSAGFAEANGLLERLGITTTRYGDFQSNDLPTAPNTQTDYEAMGGSATDAGRYYSGEGVETEIGPGPTPIEGQQTQGSPNLTKSGAQQTTKPVETAPLGSQQRYSQEFLASRPEMPAQNSTSLTGLRAAEASKGLLYASGKYWKANPNAGGEGQKDFVEIDKAEWNTIKRGDQHATQYKPSVADTDTSTDVWKQTAQDFKNDYVGLVQQSLNGTDPKLGYTIADEAVPNGPIDRTAAVTNNVTEDAPTLTQAVDVRFTDKDRTGRYNSFNNR